MEYKLSSFRFDDQIKRDDKHYVVMKINELRSACPYNATFTGEFNQNGKGFKGTIHIHFTRGEFKASAKAADVKVLMDDLNGQIKSQIEAWRQHRFEQEDTFVEFDKKVK